jgi:hypothetical protein
MTKIVAASPSNIERPRTLSAFNPDHSATKKGHRLIAEPARRHGVRITESRRSMKGGSGSRRRRQGGGGEKEDDDEKDEKRREGR